MSDVANQGSSAPEDVAARLLDQLREQEPEPEIIDKPVAKEDEAKPVVEAAPEVEAAGQAEEEQETVSETPAPWWQARISEDDPIGKTNRFYVGRTPEDVARNAQEVFNRNSELKRELERMRAEQASVEVLKELLQSKSQQPESKEDTSLKAQLAKRGINLDTDIYSQPDRVFTAIDEITGEKVTKTVEERISEIEQKKQAEAQQVAERQQFEKGVSGALEAMFQHLSQNEGVPYEEATRYAQTLAAQVAYTRGKQAMLDPNAYYEVWKESGFARLYEKPAEQTAQDTQPPVEPPKQAANPPGAKRSGRPQETSGAKPYPTLKKEQRDVVERWGSILVENGLISDADSYIRSATERLHRGNQ